MTKPVSTEPTFGAGVVRRVRQWLGEALVYGLHLLPLSLFYAPFVPFLLRMGHRHKSTLAVAARVFYYCIVLASMAALQSNIPYLQKLDLVLVVLAALAAPSLRARVRRSALSGALLGAAIFASIHALVPPTPMDMITRAAFSLLLFLGSAILFVLPPSGTTPRIPPRAYVVSLIVIGMWARLITFYMLPGSAALDRVKKVPGLTVVFQSRFAPLFLSQPPYVLPNNLNEVRFLRDGCRPGELLIGGVHLWAVDFGSGDLTRRVVYPTAQADAPLLDCSAQVAYAMDSLANEVHKFSLLDSRPLRIARSCAGRTPLHFEWPRDRSRLYTFDDSGTAYALDPGDLSCIRTLRGKYVRWLLVERASGQVVLADDGFVRVFDPEDGRIVESVDLTGGFPGFPWHRHDMGLGQAWEGGTVYAVHLTTGRITALDPRTWSRIDELEIGGGPRSVAIDGRRKLVFVGDYLRGEVVVLTAEPLRVLGRVGVGPRPISLALSNDGDRLYLASGLGAIRIDVEELLKSLQP